MTTPTALKIAPVATKALLAPRIPQTPRPPAQNGDVQPSPPEVPLPPPRANIPVVPRAAEKKEMEDDINGCLDMLLDTMPAPLLVRANAVADASELLPGKSKGIKRPRFGKNPDGTPAEKVEKKAVERKSPWGIFLHKFKMEHPDLCPAEATVEARKIYVPKSGKKKSFERIATEQWKASHPREWAKLTKEERIEAVRAHFIKLV